MIPSDDTWGISGPTFLLAYVVLAVAVAVAAIRTRRALVDVSTERPAHRLDERPYDVAFLNGGAELALTAAFSAMHRAGTISTSGRGVVVAAARPESRADELERAVHHAAATPVSRHSLATAGAVASALHRVEQRLIAAGLLLSAERRRRIRLAGAWVLVVAALGVVRVMAGLANGRPVLFLILLVLVTLAVGVLLVLRVPRRTRAGDALLRRLAADHQLLSPSMRPDWQVYGPTGAALAVGVFGVQALWAADPAFATELAAQRAASQSAGYVSGGGRRRRRRQRRRREQLRWRRRLRRWLRRVRPAMTAPRLRRRHRLAAGDRRLRRRPARPAVHRGDRRVAAGRRARAARRRAGRAARARRGGRAARHPALPRRRRAGRRRPGSPTSRAAPTRSARRWSASTSRSSGRAASRPATCCRVPRSRDGAGRLVANVRAHAGRAAGAARARADRGAVRLARRRAAPRPSS